MKRPYYIMTSGRLRRKDNTIFFEPVQKLEDKQGNIINIDIDPAIEEEVLAGFTEESEKDPESGRVFRKAIPVNDIEAFYCFSELDFNSHFFNFLSQHHIPLHFFNYYGYYAGSFIPRDYLPSGFTIVEQVKCYLDLKKRMYIAREIIDAATYNIVKNLQYYDKPSKEVKGREIDFSKEIEEIESLRGQIQIAQTPEELMGVEGNIRDRYYMCWEKIVGSEFSIKKRVKHPPDNEINAMISFCNGLVYSTVLSEIYHTHLEPTVSFLHQPGERRYSLSLDIAEIFKPIIADRMIFKLLNTKQIQQKHFRAELNFCYLEENGRKIVLQEYDERLKTTLKHRGLGRNVSYRHLIRLEAYKIVKHITMKESYKAFRIWW